MKLKNNFNKKRIRTTTNNNQNNKDHIWYKNKMSRDEIKRQINSIKRFKTIYITIKRMSTKSNIKIKCKGMNLKKNLINDLRPNTLQLKK
jgi:hypothetical protein